MSVQARSIVNDDRPPANVGMVHRLCGSIHDFNDECPAPPDSPRGMLRRAQRGCREAGGALDRLAAIDQFRRWLDDQEQLALIGARRSGCTWADMGRAVGTDHAGALRRWGQKVARLEATGLLPSKRTDSSSRCATLQRPPR